MKHLLLIATGIALLALAAAPGCKPAPADDEDTSRPAAFGYQQSVHDALLEEGRSAYLQYCVGCHGDQGDGNGPAAKFLHPPPRNFITAQYKFSSARAGRLPTDADLKRTITQGLRGSAMPAFRLLSTRTVEALVTYLKSLSPRWKEEDASMPVPLVDDPYRREVDKSEAIARGEALYHGLAICWSCHPAYVPETKINEYVVAFGNPAREGFRPNLHLADAKPNSEGIVLYPPDFLRDYVRAGTSLEDLYRSVAAGITSTAMPTWYDSIDIPGANPGDPPRASAGDLWAIAYYVQDLLKKRPPLLKPNEFNVRAHAQGIYLHGPPPKPTEPTTPETEQPTDFETDF